MRTLCTVLWICCMPAAFAQTPIQAEGRSAPARNLVVAESPAGSVATLTPGQLDFGSNTVTAISPFQTITLSNPTASAITVNATALTPRITLSPGGTCAATPFTLAAGQTCTQRVVFSSAQTGTFSGNLTPNTTPANAFTPSTVAVTGTAIPATYNFAPAALNFATTITATSPPQPVTLTNTSDVAITFSVFSASPRFGIASGGSCAAAPFTLDAGQSCTAHLVFSSQNVGTNFTGQLSIATTQTTTPSNIALTGTAVPATFSVAPAALNYTTTVTATSPPQPVTLTNTSDVAISFSVLSASPRFAIAPGGSCPAAPFTLASGQSCTVHIVFSSPNVGVGFTGQLSIATTQTTTPANVALTGTAVPATYSIYPAALSFTTTVTATSPPQTVTLSNSSDVAINFTVLSASPRFAIAPGGSCAPAPFTLASGQSCTAQFVFSSPNVGIGFTGQLTIATTQTTTPANVALTGTAVPATYGVAPAALSFTATVTATSPPQPVTLTNTSDVAISFSVLSASARFAIAPGGSCAAAPFALAPEQSCTAHIVFSSQNIGANFSGQLSIATVQTMQQAPATIALTGSAPAIAAALSPAQLDFGSVFVGTSATLLLGIGNADLMANLVIDSLQFGSPNFALAAGGSCGALPFTVAPGASCTQAVVFSPTVLGLRSSSAQLLTLPSGVAAFQPTSIGLMGTGTLEPPLFRDGFETALSPES